MIFYDDRPDNANFSTDPQPLELVAADNPVQKLSFNLPPLVSDQLSLIVGENVYLNDIGRNRKEKAGYFEREFAALNNKSADYSGSPVYLNKLASLARHAGNYELERVYINRAFDIVNNDFFLNKIGENLIVLEDYKKAEDIFKRVDLDGNVHANLRLAFLAVKKMDIELAAAYVDNAVKINPFDYGARLLEGVLFLLLNKRVEAIRSFRVAIEAKPNSSVAYANMGISYLFLGNKEKAFGALRKSVVIDPLNVKALVLLSDVALQLGKSCDVVGYLKYYSTIDDSNLVVLERLAQSYFEIGDYLSSIYVLKGVRRIEGFDPVRVWNNIGVAYHRMGVSQRGEAYKAFKLALVSHDKAEHERDALTAARNMCIMLSDSNKYSLVYGYTKSLISIDSGYFMAHDDFYSDFYVFHILSLYNLKKVKEAVDFAENVFEIENASNNLKIWSASWLISVYALDGSSKAIELSHFMLDFVSGTPRIKDDGRMAGLLNNIVFAFSEFNMLGEASAALNKLSRYVHNLPYPTATLGLFNLRSGNVERGEALYKEAIRIATGDTKEKIRQKMYYELALYWRAIDKRQAVKYLDKAAAIKNGVPQVERMVNLLRKSI